MGALLVVVQVRCDRAWALGPQSSIGFLNSLSWEEVARYRGTTLRGRTPKIIQYRLADTIDVTMIGMDAGGAPGQFATCNWHANYISLLFVSCVAPSVQSQY